MTLYPQEKKSNQLRCYSKFLQSQNICYCFKFNYKLVGLDSYISLDYRNNIAQIHEWKNLKKATKKLMILLLNTKIFTVSVD